jgi:8-oxo-dGTP pyrophosphatase MutT (NUDIX family)|tara:strand:- start:39 stop:491 length:453 start_codon:yes stop_codon:yes gene_type:complete
MSQKFRKIVFVVTYSKTNDGIKYLLLRRKFHWKGWEFIKGGIEKGEPKKVAVKREVLEEAGKKTLKIKKFQVFGKYKYKKELADRKGFVGQSFSLYSAEIKFGRIKIDVKEHSRYEWLNFNEAVKKLTFQNQKKCLKIVNDWLKNEKNKV